MTVYEAGTSNHLRLRGCQGIATTWYVPGIVMETFKENVESIVSNGHEIGTHGYLHEYAPSMTKDQEEKVIRKNVELVKDLTGHGPSGHIPSQWELSENTIDILIRNGYSYSRSLADYDIHPFYASTGSKWPKIDYSKEPESWMKPLDMGKKVNFVEIPINWWFNDGTYLNFNRHVAGKRPESIADIYENWKAAFDYMYREYEYAVLPLNIHPDVSGHPEAIMFHERFIEYLKNHSGVCFLKDSDIAVDFRKRYPFPEEYTEKL